MKISKNVTVRAKVKIPLDKFEKATFVSFDGVEDSLEHFLIIFGTPDEKTPLVRVHSECITGDLFGSMKCDCGKQLQEAISSFAEKGGILIYLRQEGRGIGLYNKLDAYLLQNSGLDTFQANIVMGHSEDSRDFGIAAQMLDAIDVKNIALITNNPNKSRAMEAMGINVSRVIPTETHVTDFNKKYLLAKALKHKHSLFKEELLGT